MDKIQDVVRAAQVAATEPLTIQISKVAIRSAVRGSLNQCVVSRACQFSGDYSWCHIGRYRCKLVWRNGNVLVYSTPHDLRYQQRFWDEGGEWTLMEVTLLPLIHHEVSDEVRRSRRAYDLDRRARAGAKINQKITSTSGINNTSKAFRRVLTFTK